MNQEIDKHVLAAARKCGCTAAPTSPRASSSVSSQPRLFWGSLDSVKGILGELGEMESGYAASIGGTRASDRIVCLTYCIVLYLGKVGSNAACVDGDLKVADVAWRWRKCV